MNPDRAAGRADSGFLYAVVIRQSVSHVLSKAGWRTPPAHPFVTCEIDFDYAMKSIRATDAMLAIELPMLS